MPWSVDMTVVLTIGIALYVAFIILASIGRVILTVFVFVAEWLTKTFGK